MRCNVQQNRIPGKEFEHRHKLRENQLKHKTSYKHKTINVQITRKHTKQNTKTQISYKHKTTIIFKQTNVSTSFKIVIHMRKNL